MTAIVFEDWSEERQMNAWYFSFQGRVHGPFGTETEADHALDAYMSDYYQDDDFEPRRETTLYWFDPAHAKPVQPQTILIVYENQVWPAVYANDKVIRYPEDLAPIPFEDCSRWAALPTANEVRLGLRPVS